VEMRNDLVRHAMRVVSPLSIPGYSLLALEFLFGAAS
jgi:hypothetical protein